MNKAQTKKKMPTSSKVLYGLVILTVAANIASSYFSGVLDTYVGVGEQIVTIKDGAENWDSAYYATDYGNAQEIDKAAKEVTKAIASEGITLLKNT